MAEIKLVKKYPNICDEDVTKIFQEGYLKGFENGRKNAIPIEWILKYRRNNRGEITYYSIDAIDHMLSEWCLNNNIDMWDMINDWEKENETN